MRLMNVKTKKLEEFFDKSIPEYAILSHTWAENEVTFRDFDPVLGPRRTSIKIDGCCAQALNDGHNYVWIDTCCIDKSSSAELSEAINSMFAWYKSAKVCYVYLSDVLSEQLDFWYGHHEFAGSRWFTRGWTLQELLAPRVLVFYNAAWSVLGHVAKWSLKTHIGRGPDLIDLLPNITGIPGSYITDSSGLERPSVAIKMSWASARQTTRVEDMAYCLLGIFAVAMPMLYGEGMKAFIRLQEEIIKNVDDHSIFAWGYGSPAGGAEGGMSVFARSPADFAHCKELASRRPMSVKSSHFVTTNKGLHMEIPLLQLVTGDYVGRINCTESSWLYSEFITIPLVQVPKEENVFYRPTEAPPEVMDISFFRNIDPQPVYISRSVPVIVQWKTGLRLSNEFCNSIRVRAVHPVNWNLHQGQCWLTEDHPVDSRATEQTIFLDCLNNEDDNFVVKIKYDFDQRWLPFSLFLFPKAAKVLAARVPSSMSLVKVIAAETQGLGEMISWQEDFVFEPLGDPSTPKFPCPVHSNYTRQIHLVQSKDPEDPWEIDVR